MNLFIHELKMNFKSWLIWSTCIIGLCFFCILLYTSMEEEMASIALQMANMGAFSEAFGIDQLSIATLEGFYAVEVGTIHALGGGLFASVLGTTLLSKEEDRHTSEFLYALPISRLQIVVEKWLSLVVLLVAFNVLSVIFYQIGFMILDQEIAHESFYLYHFSQCMMHIELGSICFLVSSYCHKNYMGIGIGCSLFLYLFDLMGRVIPVLEDYLFLTPYGYSNASDVFAFSSLDWTGLGLGLLVSCLSLIGAIYIQNNRDIYA